MQAEATEKTVIGLFEDWERVYLHLKRKGGGAHVRVFLVCDVLRYIGEQRARTVTKAQVVEIIDRVSDRGALRKANVVLALLRQMFKHGVARGIVDHDATAGLTKDHAGDDGGEVSRDCNLSAEGDRETGGLSKDTHLTNPLMRNII